MDLAFWKDKRVFLTGHTGFKGSWMSRILVNLGANVTGYSLGIPTNPNLFSLTNTENKISSVMGDIRDGEFLLKVFEEAGTDIVIHMAAQPIVRDSYLDPVYTYSTNVMGTVNILECARRCKGVKSFLNVTTDKVYHNSEWEWGYREIDPLDGLDPYSNSKSCSELVTHSYKDSFFMDGQIAISTARAGNVIGGGDFANDRIIPDCVRAVMKNERIQVRNPHSIRPYQHVLEPLFAYLLILEKQYESIKYAGYYNVGPDECDCITTGNLVDIFCNKWENTQGWETQDVSGPHEANYLRLDCSRIKSVLGWSPRWNIDNAVAKTVEWSKCYLSGDDICSVMDRQIEEYCNNGGRINV